MSQLKLNSELSSDFEERKTWFADVLIPIPLPGTYTYRIPRDVEEQVQVGCRVVVQFGKRKVHTGVIVKLHNDPPKVYEAKYILDLLDTTPSINSLQLDFFRWIAQYYMCTMGEVLNAALPGGLKMNSQSFVQLNPNFVEDEHDLSERESTIVELLSERDKLSYDEIPDLLGIKQVHPILKSLIDKEGIFLFEQVKDRYQPKKVRKIRLVESFIENETALEELFASLEKRLKQQEVLLKYLSVIPYNEKREVHQKGIIKSELVGSGISESSLKTLVRNGVLEEFEEIVSRFPEAYDGENLTISLSPQQQQSREEILKQYNDFSTVLLHGITGSGKTEIYISLILDTLNAGGQVLYLLPEIALTTQIVTRLRKVFGDRLGIYHSKYSDNERVEVWRGVETGRFDFVVGVRSSIFLPFKNLSLIVVDEEHEPSYKQYDPAPRYNARDLAIVLGNIHGSRILLGTATPSVESYENAKSGKYGFVEISERYGEATLPEFILADLQKERKRKTIKGDFSSLLINELQSVLDNGEQAILFQNRRGYSPYISCNDCSYVPQCENCSVSLTYHMYSNTLKCHYCGHQQGVPHACPACNSTAIRTVGFGTEKLEEDLKLLFPDANIQRMDQDTTRSKYSYQSIIDRFEKKETDILIGTQMVSKGLDFDSVSLVAVFDFDRMIHFPDFRSHERAFQLVTQVSGRSGRREKKGKVVIQASDIHDPLLSKIIRNDFAGFYSSEILERQSFSYPPYFRLIRIVFRHKEKELVEQAAQRYVQIIKPELGIKRVLGPQEPVISRIRNRYIQDVFIKMEKQGVNVNKIKEVLYLKSVELTKLSEFGGLRVTFDVDPL
ncbi:MAG: primosomal protein N' [Cyclobacteriaceae bacterium]